MIRAVLDTNVVASGLLNSKGPSALIVKHALLRTFRTYLSSALLEEYRAVLPRPHLRLREDTIHEFLRVLTRTAVFVTPGKRLRITRDPDDDKVIECAMAARADFLVTGNTRDFPSQFQDIRVVTPRAFLVVLASTPSKP